MRPFVPFAALLGVAFLLGCQDVGTGPDGLAPQFDKRDFGGECAVARLRGHCHVLDPEPPATNPLNVTITSTPGHLSAAQQDMSGPGLNDVNLEVNLSTFPASCNLGTKTGQLFIAQGDDHVHVSFSFTHNESGSGGESRHALSMDGVLQTGALPPIVGTPAVIVESAAGLWSITSRGKDHRNGCKENGANLVFTVTIVQPA